MKPMSTSGRGAMRVLTVHFNTPELTARLVRDFPRQTPLGRDVFIHILDNCSTPQNLYNLRSEIDGLEGVTLEVSNENVGFGEGVNLLAGSDVVDEADILWLLNPDTRLRVGCLEDLENQLVSVDFEVVSPLIYSGDDADPRIWYCGGSICTRQLSVRHLLYGRHPSEAPDDTFETDFITGAAPMMRASIFRALGGFPRGYFLYWEDVFFSWKAHDHGFRLGVVPSAHLWHAVGAASGTGQSRTFYYWSARNRFTFARDIGIPRRRLIFGRGGLHSVRFILKTLVEREGRLPKARAAIRGTIDGIRQGREPSRRSLEV
jgi:N-acetylglucosaminyl-diphospho-decaprenol L-rhamnosyltransferase